MSGDKPFFLAASVSSYYTCQLVTLRTFFSISSASAAAAKAGPKAKSSPSRPTDPDNRWFFTRKQEAAMRRMGHGNIGNDILRQHGLPVREEDAFDPDHDGDWFE